jgi:methylenetetrahydrofolate dehydrogenase (NADP+)/methenyltetrahydrofolate cyclohydrolase
MAQVLDCTAVATAIKEKCRAESDALRAKGITPKLGILRVGEKGPDLSYEKGATKAMNECNVEVQVVALPADVSQEEYIKTIRAMDADPTIHGILAFRPLDNIDETVAISQNLSAVKDVDSTTVENMGKVVIGDPTGLAPCTPQAIMAVIDHYAEEIKAHTRKKYAKLDLAKPGQEDDVCCGLDVCVINNSNIIGKPLSMMLTNRYATVSIVHHLTHAEVKNDYIKRADVVIIATPFKDTLTADMIAEGTYDIKAKSSSSMFRVADSKLTVKDGKMTVTFTTTKSYTWFFMGSTDKIAAAADSEFLRGTETDGMDCALWCVTHLRHS